MAILNQEEQERIVHAISQAESLTSGEIRIVVENTVGDVSAMDKAAHYFKELEMHQTALHNGVLIYLAIADHAFAIIGDSGIHTRVPADFWEGTKEQMVEFFRRGDYIGGLVEGIHLAADQLKLYFPRSADDVNELPNEVYFGKH